MENIGNGWHYNNFTRRYTHTSGFEVTLEVVQDIKRDSIHFISTLKVLKDLLRKYEQSL